MRAVLIVDSEAAIEKLKQTAPALDLLIDSIASASESIVVMRNSIQSLPRMTSMFNKAKRDSIESIDHLLQEFEKARRMTIEVVNHINDLGTDS